MEDRPCLDQEKNGNTLLKDEIATYVFLDFETTGLLGYGQKPRITELCLLAVSRMDMQAAGMLPRVTNKLVLCVNPQKPISKESSRLSDLYNDNLEYQHPLTEATVTLINNFLEHLSPPVCLLAHNGNSFDFPLLAAELNRVNRCMTESILCADTLELFRSLDGLPLKYTPSSHPTPLSNPKTPSNKNNSITTNPDHKLPPPIVKRKAQDDAAAGHGKERKVVKFESDATTFPLDDSDNEVVAADKVKKRLAFDDVTEIGVAIADADGGIVEEQNDADGDGAKHTKDTTDGEFSQSLEDEDYLIALDEVEKKICLPETSSNSDKSEGASTTDKPMDVIIKSNTCKDSERGRNNSSSSTFAPKSTSVDYGNIIVSYVDSGSGYLIRKSPGKHDPQTSLENKSPPYASLQNQGSKKPATAAENDVTSNISRNTAIIDAPAIETNSTANTDIPATTPNPSAGNSSSISTTPNTPWKSHKLTEIYKRTFGHEPPQAHRAEDDCVSLLCVAKATKGFMEMVHKHAVPFASIAPGY